MAAKIKRMVLLLEGPDVEQALDELISNANYDKLNLAIWIATGKVTIQTSTLSYAPQDKVDKLEEVKH